MAGDLRIAIVLLLTLITTTLALPEVIRIGEFLCPLFLFIYLLSCPSTGEMTLLFYSTTGGLFDSSDPMPKSAFQQALDRINERERSQDYQPKLNLVSMSERLPPNDSHFASKRGRIHTILDDSIN